MTTRHEGSCLFCATCGSALPRLHAGTTALVVPAGGLETPVSIRPDAHIFVASRADWDRELETAPTLDRLPP